VEKQFAEQWPSLADPKYYLEGHQKQVVLPESGNLAGGGAKAETAVAATSAEALTPEALVGSLAHELNQPLTTIATYARACARMVRAGQTEIEELLNALDHIAGEAEHAGRFIRHLRAQLLSGKSLRVPVRLNTQIQAALRRVEPRLLREDIRLQLQLADDLPEVMADPIQLEQVLLNLIQNALEAMSQTPSAQRLLTIRSTWEQAKVTVAISDTGTGLTKENAEQLFQPYRSTKPHGMGLGLSLCRSIVQAHRGQIWVAPHSDLGATFYFSLPAVIGS